MSATFIEEDRHTVLPQDVCDRAGLKARDQIEWRFEEGEIRGRKLPSVDSETLELGDVDPETLLPRQGKITPESIVKSIRIERESRK